MAESPWPRLRWAKASGAARPEVNFRDQPHGTYKLLFNALYYGSAKAVALP